MLGKLRRFAPFVGLFFVFLGVVWAVSGKSGIGGAIVSPITEKRLVSCDVDVSNQLLKAPRIESFHCERRSSCLLGSLSISPLGIIPSDKVMVYSIAQDGVKSSVVRLSIPEQTLTDTSKRVELNVCTISTAGQIKLLNKNDEVVDSRNWNVAG